MNLEINFIREGNHTINLDGIKKRKKENYKSLILHHEYLIIKSRDIYLSGELLFSKLNMTVRVVVRVSVYSTSLN